MLTAIILAGGQGSRLRSVVNDRPKVLASIAGRPFLAYLLDQLADQGCRRVILATGYRAGQIESTFGTRYRSLDLEYSPETTPLGTGGALRQALPLLDGEPVLVLNGDSYCDFCLGPFLAWHRERESMASLWLTKVADASRFGQVSVNEDGTVSSFAEKRAGGAGWINAGIYLLSRRFLDSIPAGRSVSLEREVFPGWLGRGLYGYQAAVPFLDIGTPESYAAAENFFAEAINIRENVAA